MPVVRASNLPAACDDTHKVLHAESGGGTLIFVRCAGAQQVLSSGFRSGAVAPKQEAKRPTGLVHMNFEKSQLRIQHAKPCTLFGTEAYAVYLTPT